VQLPKNVRLMRRISARIYATISRRVSETDIGRFSVPSGVVRKTVGPVEKVDLSRNIWYRAQQAHTGCGCHSDFFNRPGGFAGTSRND
jgi:hypothetical protein